MARGEDFGSDHPCVISMWMPFGTLAEYVRRYKNVLLVPSRIRLVSARYLGTFLQLVIVSQIAGSAAGLEYCRSKTTGLLWV